MTLYNVLASFNAVPEHFTVAGWEPTLCVVAELTWADIVDITDRTSHRNYPNFLKEEY